METQSLLFDLSEKIEKIFDIHFQRYKHSSELNFRGWSDKFWFSDTVRRCHLQVIDNRDTSKLWLMHVNIFPHVVYDTPILGFDVISGPKKITGSFFDYSPVVSDHSYLKYLEKKTSDLNWSRTRDLPDWAKKIFSPHIIAAGNISNEEETKTLIKTIEDLIEYYVINMKKMSNKNDPILIREKQNLYCEQQKMNPHLHKSILSMGISEKDKNQYINNVLFQEI